MRPKGSCVARSTCAVSMGDTSGLAGSLVAMNRTLVSAYRSEEAVALLEPAMEELEGIDDEVALVRLATAMSGAYAMHQDTDQALELVDRYIGQRGAPGPHRASWSSCSCDAGSSSGRSAEAMRRVALTRGALDLAESHGLVGTRDRLSRQSRLLPERARAGEGLRVSTVRRWPRRAGSGCASGCS